MLRPDHRDTLTSMHNLALMYDEQGRLGEAEKLYVQAIEARKRVLGPEHRDTLISMYNLAIFWDKQGRRSEAMALMESAFEMTTKSLGADHQDTKNPASWLRCWSDA